MNYNYLKASDGTGDAALMHIQSNRSIGSTTIDVDTVVGVPASFIATSGTLLPSGFIDPTTKCDFAGHVSGSDLTIESYMAGSSDTGHTEGQVVVIKPNTVRQDSMTTLAQVSHNDDGTLKTGIVTSAKIADSAVTSVKIADGTIATADLADASVTPTKRSGGFKVGNFTSTSGTQTITGVGFIPKLVKFTYLVANSSTNSSGSNGAADGTSQWATAFASGTAPAYDRYSSTSQCFAVLAAGSATPTVLGHFGAFNSDGFSIVWDTAGSVTVGYECYA